MSSPDSKANQQHGDPPLVYLVDDEPLLLELAEMVLTGRGYLFKKFQDPREAWSSFSAENPPPRLLITDYAMQGMNGIELLMKCKKLHPDIKTILISGTVDDGILRDSAVRVDHFLRKPYRTAELSTLAQALLGS